MSDKHNPTAEPDKLHTKSSVYARVPPELRAKINQAIADADPPSYRGIYERFKLEELGVTFTPFYYYARRIRHHIQLLEVAQLAGTPDADTAAAMHKLVAQRCIEILLRDEVSSFCLARLANAYRMTAHSLPKKKTVIETEAWSKLLRSVMTLPPTPAEIDEESGPLARNVADPHADITQPPPTTEYSSHFGPRPKLNAADKAGALCEK